VSAYKANLSDIGIPGIFVDYREPDLSYSETYDFTSGVEFWKAGAVFGGMVEYSYLTGDTQYDALVSEGMQWQSGEGRNFMPVNQSEVLFSTAHSAWGLAAMTAAEMGFSKPKNGDWIDYAKNVFDIQASRFEEEDRNGTCGGGLPLWRDPFTIKDMGSNGNLFLLAARLARFTGNQTYAAWADKTFSWAKDVRLIVDVDEKKSFPTDYRVYTSLQLGCVAENWSHQSSDHGAVTEGAAIMYNIVSSFLFYSIRCA
jgi:mannan endo-1,6-alpha-mannosidase